MRSASPDEVVSANRAGSVRIMTWDIRSADTVEGGGIASCCIWLTVGVLQAGGLEAPKEREGWGAVRVVVIEAGATAVRSAQIHDS